MSSTECACGCMCLYVFGYEHWTVLFFSSFNLLWLCVNLCFISASNSSSQHYRDEKHRIIWKFTFIFEHGEQTGEICTQCAINIIKNLIGIYERIFRTGPHLLQHYALNTSLALHLLCVNRRALYYCTIWNSIIQIDCNHKNGRSSGKPTGKIHNTKHRWKALMKCYAQWALLIYYINIILSFWRCSFAVWVQLWRKKRRGNNFV